MTDQEIRRLAKQAGYHVRRCPKGRWNIAASKQDLNNYDGKDGYFTSSEVIDELNRQIQLNENTLRQ